MVSTLVLVRHAQSIWPSAGGPDDLHRGLAPAGHEQANALTAELLPRSPAAVYSSPYLRAIQTVQPTARALGLDIVTRQALREWDSGLAPTPDWEPAYADCWRSPTLRQSGGESLEDLTARAVASLTGLALEHPDSCAIVGTHGMFLGRALVGFGCRHVDWAFCRELPMPVVFDVTFDGPVVTVRGPSA